MKILSFDLEFLQYWEKLCEWEKHSLLRIAKIYLSVHQMKRLLMKASSDDKQLDGHILLNIINPII
jgi:hypothetical protein